MIAPWLPAWALFRDDRRAIGLKWSLLLLLLVAGALVELPL